MFYVSTILRTASCASARAIREHPNDLHWGVNPSIELDGQCFGLENISTEYDPSGGVGWVLIAMDGNVICNIDRNKSDIRNMKNQIFEISDC